MRLFYARPAGHKSARYFPQQKLIMLFPSFTNLAKAGDYFLASDRYVYLPSIGIFWVILLLATAIWQTWKHVLAATWRKPIGIAMIVILAVPLGLRARTRNPWYGKTRGRCSEMFFPSIPMITSHMATSGVSSFTRENWTTP